MVVGKEGVSPKDLTSQPALGESIWDASAGKVCLEAPLGDFVCNTSTPKNSNHRRRVSFAAPREDGCTATLDGRDERYISVLTSQLEISTPNGGRSNNYFTPLKNEADLFHTLLDQDRSFLESPFATGVPLPHSDDQMVESPFATAAPHSVKSDNGTTCYSIASSRFLTPTARSSISSNLSFQSIPYPSEEGDELYRQSGVIRSTPSSAPPTLQSLCYKGILNSTVLTYLSVSSYTACKKTSMTFHRDIRPPPRKPNLKDVLVYHRRELGVGSLDDNEHCGAGLVGEGYLDQISIAALNATCREIKLATEIVIEMGKRVGQHSTARHKSISCLTNRPHNCPSSIDQRLPISFATPLYGPSGGVKLSPSEGVRRYRCLATPSSWQINFSTATSSSMALALLKRADPRMVTKISGSLGFHQEGTRRQSSVNLRVEVSKQLCSHIRFMKNLTSIDIANWPINDQWFVEFAESITEGSAEKIEEIQLTYPVIDGTACPTLTLSDTALTKLCSGIAGLRDIQVLDLSGITIRDEFASPLVQLITRKSSLRKVWLRSTKLGDPFITQLCDALKQSCYSCNYSNFAANSHGRVVTPAPGLSHICLQECRVSDKGLATLVRFFDSVLTNRSAYKEKRSRSVVSVGTFQTGLYADSPVLPRVLLGANRNISRSAKASASHLTAHISFN